MGSEHDILDISSDEEDAFFDESGENSFDFQSSLEWLSKMLELDDEPWPSNDVMVVDELSCTAPVQKLDSAQSNVAKRVSVDDSDDDCKILDGDPDKPVEVIQNEGNGSDELLIVGEKGQLACRDFPHSRHLCASFPFSTTSHEKFCKLCHCYVCDVPAPCIHWGTGSSNDDHCHSSDKEEKWRLKRKALRHANNAAEHTLSAPVATLSIRPPGMRPPNMRITGIRTSCNRVPRAISSSSMHIGPRSVPPQTSVSMHIGSRSVPAQTPVFMPVGPASVPLQNSDSRVHTFHRCSATNFDTPNIISRRRSHQSGVVHSSRGYVQPLNRNFSGTDSTLKGWRGVSPHVISAHTKERIAGAGFVNVTAKRPRTTNTSQNQVYSRKLQRSSRLPAPSVDESIEEWQDILHGLDPDLETNFQQCAFYPQPAVDSQSFSQTSANTGTTLLGSSAPAGSNPNILDGRWLNTAFVNAATNVSQANSPFPNVQSINMNAVAESNPVSGEFPSGERIGSLGQERPQEATGDQGLGELNPCTYDQQEMPNSLFSSEGLMPYDWGSSVAGVL